MLCTKCGQKQANVFYSASVNGKAEEYSLCEECAKAMGLFGNDAGIFNLAEMFSPGQFLSSLLGEGEAQPVQRRIPAAECGSCGMTYPQFARLGRFGCANCYDAFEGMLPSVLKKLHVSSHHVGKIPGRSREALGRKHELDGLRQKLKDAVGAEEYEKAAGLRDRIKKIESEMQA